MLDGVFKYFAEEIANVASGLMYSANFCHVKTHERVCTFTIPNAIADDEELNAFFKPILPGSRTCAAYCTAFVDYFSHRVRQRFQSSRSWRATRTSGTEATAATASRSASARKSRFPKASRLANIPTN